MRTTKCPRSTIESTSNRGQCLKSLEISKEAFYVFRRIKCENSWKWNKFKTVMYLSLSTAFKTFPGCLITATKHSVLRFLSGFLAFIQWIRPQGSLSPSHIPYPDKNTRKKQCFHSTLGKRVHKASEWEAKKGPLGGGLIRRTLFLESVRSVITVLPRISARVLN